MPSYGDPDIEVSANDVLIEGLHLILYSPYIRSNCS